VCVCVYLHLCVYVCVCVRNCMCVCVSHSLSIFLKFLTYNSPRHLQAWFSDLRLGLVAEHGYYISFMPGRVGAAALPATNLDGVCMVVCMCMCLCVCVCVRARTYVCMRAYVLCM